MLIKVVEDGCPVCEGEVKGNYRAKYFCKHCNMLFRSSQLKKGHKISAVITDNNKVLKRNEHSE